jgi:DNA-binding XRE family transcriptional regulator
MKRYEIHRTIRNIVQLSGIELAERVEVTKQTISNYENGRCYSKPTQRVIEIELDLEVDKMIDSELKHQCHILQNMRKGALET